MARNADKKERGGGDEPGPGPQGGTAGGQSGTASPAGPPIDLWTAHGGAETEQPWTPAASSVLGTDGASAGPPEAVGPGAPPELPHRKPRVSHRRHPAQPGPVAAASTVGHKPEAHKPEASTEPIPVIRVSPAGEPLPPAGLGEGSPAPDDMPVTAAVQAPDQAAAPRPSEQAPLERAAVDRAPVEQAPVARDVVAPVTPEMPLGLSRRSRGKGSLRARVARGLAAAPQPPAGPENPERQAARQQASEPAEEETAAQGTAAADDDSAAQDAPGREDTAGAAEDTGQAVADQEAADRAAADREAADREATERAAADREATERQAQQIATRRALDEAIIQRAAAVLARKSSSAWTRRQVSLAVVIVLVFGGVAAGFAFLGSRGHQSHRPPSISSPTAVVNRDHAAAWVAKQVSPATVVSCDPATCTLLESHRFPASQVRILGPGKGNPLVSNVVVATPAVRRQFGAQLTSVYAPGMLATFGSGSRQVDIQLVAPHGAAAYRAALKSDLQNRRQSGAGLSGSNRIQAPSSARKQLAAGQVDSRLMITLALMASLHPVHLVTFGDGGPDLGSAPLRSAELSLTGGTQQSAVLTFLRQQRPPYQPMHVTTKPVSGDRILLIMEFSAPSPVGLFH
jgi:hypothetical protein